MTELDVFERRLVAALAGYADEVETDVDAVAVADGLVDRRSWRGPLALPQGLTSRRTAGILVVAAAVLALVSGFLLVGGPLREDAIPIAPVDVEVVVPPSDDLPWFELVPVSRDEAWGLAGGSSLGGGPMWHFDARSGSGPSEWVGAPYEVRDIALASDATLWAATSSGAMTLRDGTWESAESYSDATSIAIGHDGTVWLGYGSGVISILRPGGSSWVSDGIPHPPLPTSAGGFRAVLIGSVMTVDRDGGLWLSGGGKSWISTPGLVHLSEAGAAWERITLFGDFTDMRVPEIEAAPNGDVWIVPMFGHPYPVPHGAEDVQVARYGGQRWTTFGTSEGLPAGQWVHSLAIGPNGTVWLSGTGGLFSFRDGRWIARVTGRDLGRIATAPDGTLWASGEGGVVRIVDPSR